MITPRNWLAEAIATFALVFFGPLSVILAVAVFGEGLSIEGIIMISLGHGGALYYLALLHLNGEPQLGITSSINEFVRYLDEAVEAGNADALFTRGHCHYHGSDGYQQDYLKALKDFLRAAYEGHHADAAVSAGAILHTGIDGIILRDQEKAFELYQNAGEWGSREGWQNVVACYISGEGVPQSLEIAEYIAETMLKKKLFPPKD